MESLYLYWFGEVDFSSAKERLKADGYRLSATLLTPCQVLKSRGKKIVYAPPSIWSRICVRQGSWYRNSARQGQYMVMSDHRLPAALDRFWDTEMRVSDFMPARLPDQAELEDVVGSEEYQQGKPQEWEGIAWKDVLMFKVLFGVTGFWKRGDNLKKHWLGQRANHANFLARQVTTELEGEQVPYSVTENAGVCSSCAEFFNVIAPESRKLVRSCPGAVIFGGSQRDTYYDVRPQAASSASTHDQGKSSSSKAR